MNRKLLHILLSGLLALAAMYACSMDEKPIIETPEEVDPFKDGSVPVNIPILTKAVNDGNLENKVVDARLIVIKANKITNNKRFTVTNVGAYDSVHVYDIIPVGVVDLFIVVNERPAWNLDSATFLPVGTSCTAASIEQKILSFASPHPTVDATNPIPMYSQYRNLLVQSEAPKFTIGGVPVTTLGEVDRLYAKVTLDLRCKFSELANGGDPIQLDSISIKSLPKYSYLSPTLPFTGAAADFVNGPRIHHPTGYVVNTDSFVTGTVSYYIPEHHVNNPAYKTYISVKVSLKGNVIPAQQREYKIVIGDGITTCTNDSLLNGSPLPIQNLFVTRNTHYMYFARIKSFDERSEQDIEIRPYVVGWDTVSEDVLFREYTLTVSQDKFTFSRTLDYHGLLRVTTDYPGGWTAELGNGGVAGAVTFGGTYSTPQTSNALLFNYTAGAAAATDTIKVSVGSAGRVLTKKVLLERN
jgi:hypothetical protein